MPDRERWIRHIKELRARDHVSIFEAERITLSDPSWKRWLERQINTDQRCHRMALYHVKLHGEAGLLMEEDGVLKVRDDLNG